MVENSHRVSGVSATHHVTASPVSQAEGRSLKTLLSKISTPSAGAEGFQAAVGTKTRTSTVAEGLLGKNPLKTLRDRIKPAATGVLQQKPSAPAPHEYAAQPPSTARIPKHLPWNPASRG